MWLLHTCYIFPASSEVLCYWPNRGAWRARVQWQVPSWLNYLILPLPSNHTYIHLPRSFTHTHVHPLACTHKASPVLPLVLHSNGQEWTGTYSCTYSGVELYTSLYTMQLPAMHGFTVHEQLYSANVTASGPHRLLLIYELAVALDHSSHIKTVEQ